MSNWVDCSNRFKRRSRTDWEWGWRSVAPSLKFMAAGCGAKTTRTLVQRFVLNCPSMATTEKPTVFIVDDASSVPIIFITGHGDIPTSVRAMKEGAIDFLPKPFQDEALLHAVAMALDRSIRERTEYAEKQLIQQRVDMLTPREREVLEFVVTGMLNKQIARKLGTTEKTIKVHRGRVMEKMCVDSVAQLVRAAEKVSISPATPKS